MTDPTWPAPDPATGDGSDYGETEAPDGTPGAVGSPERLRVRYLAARARGVDTDVRDAVRAAMGVGRVARVRAAVRALVGLPAWPVIASPNYSTRGKSVPRLIILHTAEGAKTRQELGGFFSHASSGVSSHVGIDDTGITRYVPDEYSAWTARNANPVAVQAELCAFTAWTPAEWARHPGMLENAAQWVAAMSTAHGIPLTRLTPQQTVTASGVCVHHDITVGWRIGSHVDCGTAFPIDDVIVRARQIVAGNDEDWLTMDVPAPYAGPNATEPATTALGYMEQRIREGIAADLPKLVTDAVTAVLPQLVATAVKSALADQFAAIPTATTKAVMGYPLAGVDTWDAATKTVVSKDTSVEYAVRRAQEASIVRHRQDGV